ncbi:MAG: hypothetical protein IK051_02610, partial [Rhodocyclaceae bacterium]|nr:hypothetical protein [Rhodocyclaceae bacterium]
MLLSGLNNIAATYMQLAVYKGLRGQSGTEGTQSSGETKDASSVVTLSDAAKALASKPLTFEEVGKQAREKLDEIIKQT